MCRLYGLCATEPTKVECTLVHAQNALMTQSRADLSGKSHAHGWGVATYENGMPTVERQAWAAYHGEHFKRAAAQIFANTVIAHIRHATVGDAAIENTHPFVHGKWVFAHNGTVPNFQQIKEKLLGETAPSLRAAIKGQTDSEHIFYYALTVFEREELDDLQELISRVIGNIEHWCLEIDPSAPIGLNIMLTDGRQFAGSRLGRTLYHIEREGIYDCEICGFPHIHHQQIKEYRAIVVASEPVTHEDWNEIPNRSVWSIGADRKGISISSF